MVFKTTNGGINWIIKYREKGGMVNDISYFNNLLWVAGKDSSILFSSDNGDNWVKQNTNSRRRFNSVFFVNENTGWAAGYRYPDTTNIIKSSNGGVTWFNLKNLYSNTLNSIFFIDENTGWAAGNKYPSESGIILKTITGGLNAINTFSIQSPIEFRLDQNYPNPFNPSTVIRYSLTGNKYVSLKVYNALGNEVANLVNEKQNAGTYEVDFNGSELSSGIYFYKFTADNFTDTKRMILLK